MFSILWFQKFRTIEKNSYITGYLWKLKLKELRGLKAGPVISCKFDNSPSVFVVENWSIYDGSIVEI